MGLQGPVLSGHKTLVAEKLAEEVAERRVKGEAKKEKHLVFRFSLYLLIYFVILACICMLHIYSYIHISKCHYIYAVTWEFVVLGGREGACKTC